VKASEKRRRRHELEDRAVFFVKAGLVAFLAYTFSAMSLAPVTSTCTSCHSGIQASHEGAAHADIECNSCHSGTTVSERLNFRISYARMLPATILSRQPSRTLVPNQACATCHADDILMPLLSETGIRISHSEKISGGYQCTDCHSATGHEISDASVRHVDMFSCFDCHRTLESARCELCHAERGTRERPYQSVWRLTHGENWQALHGMGGLETCNVCHHPSYCVKCHGIELPHPSGFNYRHGEPAKAADTGAVCSDCHDEQGFCLSCHQVPMPHPDRFLQTHLETPKEDEEKCLRCHDQDSCLECHVRHIHPGIPADDLRQMRGRIGLE